MPSEIVPAFAELCRQLDRTHRSTGRLPRPGWARDVTLTADGSLRLPENGLQEQSEPTETMREAGALLQRLLGEEPSPALMWVMGRCQDPHRCYGSFGELADAVERWGRPGGEPSGLQPFEPRRPLPRKPRPRARGLLYLWLVVAAALLFLALPRELPGLRGPAVYAGEPDGLVMLDAGTGAALGRLPLGGPPRALAATGDTLLILMADRLEALDLASGRLRTALAMKPGTDRLAAGPAGRALVIDSAGGRVTLLQAGPRPERLLLEPGPVTAALGPSALFLGARDRLRALRPADLELLGEADLALAGPLVVEGDRVYALDREGSAWSFASPDLRAPRRLPGGTLTLLAAPRRLWMVDRNGRIREVDPERGIVLRETDVGQEVTSAILVRSGRGTEAWLPLADQPAVAVVDLDRSARTGTLRCGRPLCFVPGGGAP